MTRSDTVRTKIKKVNVAIAVIKYDNQYLLAYRNASQHQGNLYEFVGGKIETDETPLRALKRELVEEIGLTINDKNVIAKLGNIEHDYCKIKTEVRRDDESPKTVEEINRVCLQVHLITLTQQQYDEYSTITIGCEGQPLVWVNKQALINQNYPLPEANKQILTWLKQR